MIDDFSLHAPGFTHRDNWGRKFTYHYATDRRTLLDQSVAIAEAIKESEGTYSQTLEGKFLISSTGAIQFNEQGFHTENILGYRVQWRMQIFLGKVIRPPRVTGYTKFWLFRNA